MLEAALFTLILIISNGGGDGKTTWGEALTALARLAGLRTAVLDVDPGLRGYSRRNGADAAERLEWSGDFDNGRDLPGWLGEAMAQDIAVVDTGANLLAADKEVSARLSDIAAHVHESGGQLIIHAVTSPNKPGSDVVVEDLYDQFASSMEFAVIKNQRDGSSSFGKKIDDLQAPKVEVPYISPGLQAYKLRRALPLKEIISVPEPGFTIASALLAEHLRAIARSSHVGSLIGNAVDEQLSSLSAGVRAYEGRFPRTIEAVPDDWLKASRDCDEAYRSFRNADPGLPEVFISAAYDLHCALEARDQLEEA